MSKTAKLVSNIVVISVASIITTVLVFFRYDLGTFYHILNGILLAIMIFVTALAVTKDSSIPEILRSDRAKGSGITKNIPFARFFIAVAVYVLFDVCSVAITPPLSSIAATGDITALMLLSAAYETLKWYAVFLILSVRVAKPVNIIGMIIAFILPYIIIVAQSALELHNYHIIVNNGGGLITTMNAFVFRKYSQNSVVSMLFQFGFTAVTPIIYVIIGHLMRKKKTEKKTF